MFTFTRFIIHLLLIGLINYLLNSEAFCNSSVLPRKSIRYNCLWLEPDTMVIHTHIHCSPQRSKSRYHSSQENVLRNLDLACTQPLIVLCHHRKWSNAPQTYIFVSYSVIKQIRRSLEVALHRQILRCNVYHRMLKPNTHSNNSTILSHTFSFL